MIDNSYSTLVLSDGAKIAYEVLGIRHIRSQAPIVLIGGLSSCRGDWERLAASLAVERPVLLFDHRGMRDSTLAQNEGEEITVESLARDLFCLLRSLSWEEFAICGFSMGGVIAQQLLFLPYHPLNPTPIPFKVTHVLLTGTLCSVLQDNQYILKFDKNLSNWSGTPEEKKAIVRSRLEFAFDPQWVASPANSERFEWLLNRMFTGRPISTIRKRTTLLNIRHLIHFFNTQVMQVRALNRFDFPGLHEKLPRDLPFLVIHGKLDAMVPFYYGQELLKRIPWAKMVEVGPSPGQVENLAFGHTWFEYFDIQVWHDAIQKFLGENGTKREAISRL